MKSKDFFSELKFNWLGIVFLFLAVLAFAATLLYNRADPDLPVISGKTPIVKNTSPDDGSDERKNLLERLEFQKVHLKYQTSYLDLIQKIGTANSAKIDLRKDRDLFKNYNRARGDFTDTLKKVEEYEKDFRLKCFARMRSLILAVLFYDRKAGSRMSKFDPEQLIKIGALQEIPICPRGGKYSIVYKDGRRLFHCSLHGTLKN